MPQISLRLEEDEIARLDTLAKRLGVSRSDCIRTALDSFERRYGHNDWRETVSRLIDLYGADAELTFVNHFDVHDETGAVYEVRPELTPGTMTLAGPITPSVDPIWQHAVTRWDLDAHDQMTVWLEPVSTKPDPVRVPVGTMPHKASARLTVKLIDLLPDPLVLRTRAIDGSIDEVKITGQQAIDLANGKPIAYTVNDERITVGSEGEIIRHQDARPRYR